MTQTIIVFVIVGITIIYSIYSLIKSLNNKKKSACGGCSGCDIKKEITKNAHHSASVSCGCGSK